MLKRHVVPAILIVVAALAVAATPAFATGTERVNPAGDFKYSSAAPTLTDGALNITCTGATLKGTITADGTGTLTSVTFTTCTGPLGINCTVVTNIGAGDFVATHTDSASHTAGGVGATTATTGGTMKPVLTLTTAGEAQITCGFAGTRTVEWTANDITAVGTCDNADVTLTLDETLRTSDGGAANTGTTGGAANWTAVYTYTAGVTTVGTLLNGSANTRPLLTCTVVV